MLRSPFTLVFAVAGLGSLAAMPLGDGVETPVRALDVAASKRFDDGFACQNGTVVDGAMVIADGVATSMGAHAVPLEIEFRIKSRTGDVRIGYAANAIAFNVADRPGELRIEGGPVADRHVTGAGSLPTDKMVVIRQVVADDGMVVFVDGQQRADWTASFRGVIEPIRISTHGALTIESVHIKRLAAGRSIVDEIDPTIRLARGSASGGGPGGLHAYGEHDPRKGAALEVAAPFDVKRDWRLDLMMIAGDLNNYGQMVMVWGDTRPGKDTIWIRQRARGIEVGTWGEPNAFAMGMLPEARLKEWVSVTLRFDAAKKRLFLSIDGQPVADSPCGDVTFDRPMPVCIGQAFNGDQLFTGRVRDVVLENR